MGCLGNAVFPEYLFGGFGGFGFGWGLVVGFAVLLFSGCVGWWFSGFGWDFGGFPAVWFGVVGVDYGCGDLGVGIVLRVGGLTWIRWSPHGVLWFCSAYSFV